MGPSTAVKLLWTLVLAIPLLVTRAATPEAALTGFIDAWNQRDVAAAAKFVVGGKPGEDFKDIMAAFPKGMKFTLGEMKTTYDGDKAKITVPVKAEAPNEKTMDQTENVDLVKVNGEWLIVPASQDAKTEQIVAILAMITTKPPIFAQAREAAKKTACLSNMKQLCLGVMLYLADHDDKYSMNASKLKATLNPYLKNDQLWYCPEGPKDKVAYSINPNLLGKSDTQIPNPAETILMYEGAKGQFDFRHAGMAAVGFADGHAKMVTPETAKKLRWKP